MYLTNNIQKKDIIVGIYGLGKIGLPLACAFIKEGIRVFGLDINEQRVNDVSQGICPSDLINEPGVAELIKKGINEKLLEATTDYKKCASEVNVHILIVPTLIDENRNIDLLVLKSVCENIAKYIKLCKQPRIISNTKFDNNYRRKLCNS